ncbi:hypothetical protein K432DRAFT_312379 [Lepidopterella palustris CBS 459.81]|uniref:Uncharacterized protein n=1 Tax=Lepidopterella palustris CBS 459.81 TaxID=1314670 RepID=A0A8E2DY23_9PEZI|nr:hypothetical protein K432DRAFT_312379 [Lepidopterella palustris CBS 459.81]
MPCPLLFLTCLLAFASAGHIDIGGMFLPRDLFANIKAKPVPSLLPRADTQITVRCAVDYGYDSAVAEPPSMARLVRVVITGLADADNHADMFRKDVEDACSAASLKVYTPDQNLPTDIMAVWMRLKVTVPINGEDSAPRYCQEDAIRKFTGLIDFVECDYMGF